MIGKEIFGYRVDEKIGSGGFGTVYKVSKTNAAGTYVRALKHITLPTKKQYASVLNSMGGSYEKADDYFAGVLNDIVSEIRILSSLSESGTNNIVRYYENDIEETVSPKSYDIYIMMEYLTPFPDYFDSRAFTVRDVIGLGRDILMALISCHGKNIIHRDIKDDNIFVSNDGAYKLGDFGVSKSLKDKSRAESLKGTPNFIAPEVYLGKEKYDNTVDLYSLGIVLYKLLNKSRNPFMPPFPEAYNTDDENAAFEKRMTGQIPELPYSAKNELGEAILKAISPRAARYNSAVEFFEALCDAERNLSENQLSEVVNVVMPTNDKQNTGEYQMNASDVTVGGRVFVNNRDDESQEDERHLFDTIAAPRNNAQPQNGSFNPNQSYPNPNQSYPPNMNGSYQNPGQSYPPNMNGSYPNPNQSYPPSYNQSYPNPNATYPPNMNGTYPPNQQPYPPQQPQGYAPGGAYPPNYPPQQGYAPAGGYNPFQPQIPTASPYADEKTRKRAGSTKGKVKKFLTYGLPFIIPAVYIIVYMIILPNIYDGVLNWFDWLFTTPGSLKETLNNLGDFFSSGKKVFGSIYMILFIKILNWLAWIAWFVSIFFMCARLNHAKPPVREGALMAGKEPYYSTMDYNTQISSISEIDVSAAQNAVYSLMEKFKNESDFGSGSDTVLRCETEIVNMLRQIEANIPALRDEATNAQATKNIEQLTQQIKGKLKIRIELKKR